MQPEIDWDRKVAQKLREIGLKQDQIGVCIGIIAEHRMNADHDGYVRGYNDGAESKSENHCKGC